MNKVAIHGRSIPQASVHYVRLILSLLEQNGKEVFLSPQLRQIPEMDSLASRYPIYEKADLTDGFEAIFSLGGDGTLLDTLTHTGGTMLPILGINLGRLGFLATISKENIESTLGAYFRGEFAYDHRTLIHLKASDDLFRDENYALNEFAILRKDTSSMIVVKSYLDGEFLNTYWADGLMVATPTGSTGYSLSCGGPVIMPHTRNFIITPISPHNLNVRPLIISDESEIRFVVESNQSYQISLDSRSQPVMKQQEFIIRKAPFTARLIRIEGSTFLDTLRNKLTWGLDKRN